MKNLFIVAFLGVCHLAGAQLLTPPPGVLGYYVSGGMYDPFTGIGTGAGLLFPPPGSLLYFQSTVDQLYYPCSQNGCGGGTASAVPFSGITSGTNTQAAMVVGTGASLATSGSGSINATLLSGNPIGTSGADVPLLNGTNTWSAPQTFGSVYTTLFGSQGDTTASPSLFDYVTSTGGAGTITTPASHALSTNGTISGYACLVQRVFISGSNYSGYAICTGSGSTINYFSVSHPLGSESWSAITQETSAQFTSFGFVKATTTFIDVENSSVASASTIAPTTSLFHLTGTTTVNIMTPPLGMTTSVGAGTGGSVDFIADAITIFAAGTSVGSFKTTFTTVANTPYRCSYTPSTGLWYCK